MYVSNSKVKKAIKVFNTQGGTMRTRQVLEEGIHQRTLYHMRDTGILIQLERGVYQLASRSAISNPDLVIVAMKIPLARICLISSLSFHDLTDEIPNQVHIAQLPSSWESKLNYPPTKLYRFSEKTYNAGVQTHKIDGVDVKVYNPAKTIADCFKFRNQIGLSIAVEALKRGLSENRVTVKEVVKYAKICRVEKVIRPYLEVISHG